MSGWDAIHLSKNKHLEREEENQAQLFHGPVELSEIFCSLQVQGRQSGADGQLEGQEDDRAQAQLEDGDALDCKHQ